MKSTLLERHKEDSEILAKAKRLARFRIEELSTEEEITAVRDKAGRTAASYWEMSHNANSISSCNHWHDMWEVEDATWKVLTDYLHNTFHTGEMRALRGFLSEVFPEDKLHH